MHFIRKQVLNGDFLGGAWCNMSSAISTEIVANAGLDWMLIDQEHAAGDTMTLLGQLQSIGQKPIAPIVRVAWNDRIAIKRALDQGASGIMVPYVQSQEEAEQAVRLLRFPPDGERGVPWAHGLQVMAPISMLIMPKRIKIYYRFIK